MKLVENISRLTERAFALPAPIEPGQEEATRAYARSVRQHPIIGNRENSNAPAGEHALNLLGDWDGFASHRQTFRIKRLSHQRVVAQIQQIPLSIKCVGTGSCQ